MYREEQHALYVSYAKVYVSVLFKSDVYYIILKVCSTSYEHSCTFT